MRNALIAVALLYAASAHADQSVLTYHGALDRAGRYVVPGLTYDRARGLRLDPSFHAAFQGKVYAQPLLWRRPGSGEGEGEVIVATEDNEVFALDARSGVQIWKRALGPPVQRSALPCGNISSLGVTGAPVIDEQRATLYLDAAIMRAKGPRHEIFALSLADGSIEPGWPLDVATALGASFDPSVQNQRGALALFKGKVFVPFSGHWGDCGTYHGFVVGVSVDEPGKVTSFSTRARGGGIWAQGGVSGDGQSLFAVTGNTFGTSGWFGTTGWSDGEAVLRLSPDLARPIESRDYFAPLDWRDLDRRDLDLGGTAAIPLDLVGPNRRQEADFRHRKDRRGLSSRSRQPRRRRRRARKRAGNHKHRHHLAGRLERRGRRFCRSAGRGRALPARGTGGRSGCAENSRRPRAGNRDRLVWFRRPGGLADRDDDGRPLGSDRIGRGRRG